MPEAADKTTEEDKAEQAKEEAAATVAEQKQNAVPAPHAQ